MLLFFHIARHGEHVIVRLVDHGQDDRKLLEALNPAWSSRSTGMRRMPSVVIGKRVPERVAHDVSVAAPGPDLGNTRGLQTMGYAFRGRGPTMKEL